MVPNALLPKLASEVEDLQGGSGAFILSFSEVGTSTIATKGEMPLLASGNFWP